MHRNKGLVRMEIGSASQYVAREEEALTRESVWVVVDE